MHKAPCTQGTMYTRHLVRSTMLRFFQELEHAIWTAGII